jgi:hypothetical protein
MISMAILSPDTAGMVGLSIPGYLGMSSQLAAPLAVGTGDWQQLLLLVLVTGDARMGSKELASLAS